MTDQQRGDCLGAAGHPCLQTPTMDHIGRNGVRFSRAYATSPVCVPARRSFLSGQHPSTHRVFNNGDNAEWDGPTLPGILSDAGYQTQWIGRGMHQEPPYKRYGFDHMIFQDYRAPDDYDEFIARRHPESTKAYYDSGIMHNDWTARPFHLEESLHPTNWTVQESLRFLQRRDPSCPFFLVTSFLAPHPPLIPPAFYFDRYLRQDLPPPAYGDWAEPPELGQIEQEPSSEHVHLTGETLRSARAAYYGLINHIDDQLRRILQPVDGIRRQTGRDTIIIFLSDHGEMLGDHYRWRKSLPYEGSAHIPFIIEAPDAFGIRKNAVEETPVSIEDLFPTVLDFAGLDCPDSVDGKSLLPLLRGQSGWDRPHLHLDMDHRWQSLTDGNEKYVFFPQDGSEQLFNLSEDPRECHNLARIPEFKDRLRFWRAELQKQIHPRTFAHFPQAPLG